MRLPFFVSANGSEGGKNALYIWRNRGGRVFEGAISGFEPSARHSIPIPPRCLQLEVLLLRANMYQQNLPSMGKGVFAAGGFANCKCPQHNPPTNSVRTSAHRHTAGDHHSKRITREGSSTHRPVGGGDGTDSHDHCTAAAAEDINREASDGKKAAGNEYDGSSKGHQSDSNVGTFPKSEKDRIAEPLNGGGHRSARGSRLNPPIAVFGRPNHAIFPGLEDTHFGEGVEEGGATAACEVLRSHFEKKEVLKARVNFLLYQVRLREVLLFVCLVFHDYHLHHACRVPKNLCVTEDVSLSLSLRILHRTNGCSPARLE